MSELNNFAFETARRYLQSIVFVDDKIFDQPSASIEQIDVPMGIDDRSEVVHSDSSESHENERDKSPDDDSVIFHPKDLVESFAKEHMVCALYEPQQGFATTRESDIFRLCERSDAFILDWDLFDGDGENTLELITELVKSDKSTVPYHVRLCIVYTITPRLHDIAEKIEQCLNKKGISFASVSGSSLRLSVGPNRIIILGKPCSQRAEDEKHAEVREIELAPRLICEFASIHHGILSSLALHGMASLRTSTQRILTKFNSDLDLAFLIHRGMTLDSADAFEELPQLIADEIVAVLEDNWICTNTTEKLA